MTIDLLKPKIDEFLFRFEQIYSEEWKDLPSFSWVLSPNLDLLAESYNSVQSQKVSNFHSELVAVENAQKNIQSRYLVDCTLITTLEPCLMCTGAILLSRTKTVVYLAENDKGNGISSLPIESIYSKNHFPYIIHIPIESVSKKFSSFFRI